jgi:hypothetical protein
MLFHKSQMFSPSVVLGIVALKLYYAPEPLMSKSECQIMSGLSAVGDVQGRSSFARLYFMHCYDRPAVLRTLEARQDRRNRVTRVTLRLANCAKRWQSALGTD